MNFWNLLFLGKQNFYHKTNWFEALFAKVVGAGRKLIAKFLKIKGNTLVWNQQAKELNSTNWLAESGTATYSSGLCTITPTGYNARISADAIIVVGHKYLMTGEFTNTDNQPVYFYIGAIGSYETGIRIPQTSSLTRQSKIYTATETGKIYVRNNSNTGVFSVKNLMLIDLTAMFGSTKADEIYAMEQSQSGSGVNYFRSLFPLNYYSYGQKLLTFKGTGIKTTGTNEANGSYEQGAINQSSNISYQASKVSSTTRIRISSLAIAETGKTYKFEWNSVLYDCVVQAYNENQLSTGASGNPFNTWHTTSFTFTGTGYVAIAFKRKDGANITPSEIDAIRPNLYLADTESTTSIPTLTYFPTGMKSAGSVYDELSNNKVITRVGSFTFNGTEDWVMETQGDGAKNFYIRSTSTRPDDAKKGTFNGIVASKDFHWRTSDSDLTNIVYSGKSSGLVQVRVASDFISDIDTTKWKTYLTSNPITIHYELATPTEVDIDPPLKLNYQVWEGGTEQLLPVNTDVPTTSPILADIKYPDGERDNQYFTYRQYLPNSRMMSMALNTIMGRNVEFNQEALDILMKGE